MKLRSALLRLETWLTAFPFVASWLVCAVYLSIKAGYLMANAESSDKVKILEKLWSKSKP